ncbi:MAG: glycosyltransferase [Bacteroidetes bacterium]|nr:glycosyltransferase [Bacteroidota bacterium]
MIAFSFFTLFAALTAVYLLFLFRIRAGIRFLAGVDIPPLPHHEDPRLPAVTVLVPARNEATHIAACVTSLRAQCYDNRRIEVIVLDDHSEDNTVRIAREAIADDPRFRILATAGEGKKAALTEGVAAAQGEVVITTDADCHHDPEWLHAMVAPFIDGADIVAGPVVYNDRSTFFRRLQALEFLGLVGVGAGFFGIGYPRLCNGANLAYRRKAFIEANGYAGNDGVQSGDDEFLLHRIVYECGGRASFVTRPEAIVRTAPAPTVRAFLAQRVRWASKGREYSDGRFVSFLVLLFVFLLFAAAAPLVTFFSLVALPLAAVFFLVKLTADTAVLNATAALLRQPVRPADLLAAELIHPYYLVMVSLVGLFGRYTWKTRRIGSNRTSRSRRN